MTTVGTLLTRLCPERGGAVVLLGPEAENRTREVVSVLRAVVTQNLASPIPTTEHGRS